MMNEKPEGADPELELDKVNYFREKEEAYKREIHKLG